MQNEQRKFSKKFIKRAVVLWSSFLAACVGFVFVFAAIDPQALGHILTFPMQWSSSTGYAAGFAVLFCVAAISSILTLMLLKKRPKTTTKKPYENKESSS